MICEDCPYDEERIEKIEDKIHVLETCMEKLLKSGFIRKEVTNVFMKEIEELSHKNEGAKK